MSIETLELEQELELEESTSDGAVETADHSDFLAFAREIIAEEGRVVNFGIIPNIPVDANRPWRGSGAAPDLVFTVETFAVFVPLFGNKTLGFMAQDIDMFKSFDEVLLVAPPVSGEQLSNYNAVEIGGVRHKINHIMELKPASVSLLYAMGVSR